MRHSHPIAEFPSQIQPVCFWTRLHFLSFHTLSLTSKRFSLYITLLIAGLLHIQRMPHKSRSCCLLYSLVYTYFPTCLTLHSQQMHSKLSFYSMKLIPHSISPTTFHKNMHCNFRPYLSLFRWRKTAWWDRNGYDVPWNWRGHHLKMTAVDTVGPWAKLPPRVACRHLVSLCLAKASVSDPTSCWCTWESEMTGLRCLASCHPCGRPGAISAVSKWNICVWERLYQSIKFLITKKRKFIHLQNIWYINH